MIDKYRQAINATFAYLNDYLSDPETAPLDIPEAIRSHMKLQGFSVRCFAYGQDRGTIAIIPEQDMLPIRIWREDF